MRKTALITGASKRIGAQIARDLAIGGWDIGLHYNTSEEDAEKLAEDINQIGQNTALIKADLTETESCEKLLKKCAEHLTQPTLLINNASLFEEDHMGAITDDLWDAHMNINVKAPAMLSQSFAQGLNRSEKGLIVNIIDQRVWKLTPHFISYTTSKSALWSLTQQLAQALAPHIRVNAIGPGPTLQGKRQSAQDFAKQQSAVLLETGASPEHISAAIKFLLDQPSITGQMIAMDGGQHLAWQTPDVIGITE